jgi:hypothetical protein
MAIDLVPGSTWAAVLDPDGQPRDLEEAGVVEVTALLREGPGSDRLGTWPTDMRIIACREKPHPGAQLSLFETIDGWRYQLVATNTPGKIAQFLEARHRPHARVEDCIRTGKDTGLGHLPRPRSRSTGPGVWLPPSPATCWLATPALPGRPTGQSRTQNPPLQDPAHRRPHRPRPTQTQKSASLRPGPGHTATGRLPARRSHPTPTNPMLINYVPHSDQGNHPELWNPAPTRSDNRAPTRTAPRQQHQ